MRRALTSWTPAALSPHFFLQSSLGITLNSSTVSAQADQGSNGLHVTQGTANKQPLYAAADAAFGNQPSITFDGSNDNLIAASAADWAAYHDGTTPTTLLFVAVRVTNLLGLMLTTQNGSGLHKGFSIRDNGSGSLRYTMGTGAAFAENDGPAAMPTLGTAYAIKCTWAGGASGAMKIYRGSTQLVSFTGLATPVAGASNQPLTIGNDQLATFGSNVKFAAIVGLTRAITAAEDASWLSWVTSVYGTGVVVV